MNQVGAYGVCRNNMEILRYPLRNMEKEQIFVNPTVKENSVIEGEKNFKEYLGNALGVYAEDVSWGRVIQKEGISRSCDATKSGETGCNRKSNGTNEFMCAFVETPTVLELFEKDRNMDRRNVEERTFAMGGKVLDFTV